MTEPTGIAPDPMVARALRLMETAYAGESGLDRLAQAVGLSRYHFHRQFTAATGWTPHDVVSALRIRGAKRDLALTDASVAEVARRAGYSSAPSFSRRFLRLVGLTPTAFRSVAATLSSGTMLDCASRTWAGHFVEARVRCARIPDMDDMVVLFGVFPNTDPRGRPLACVVSPSNVCTTIRWDPDHPARHVFALAMPAATTQLAFVLGDYDRAWVGHAHLDRDSETVTATLIVSMRAAFEWEPVLISGVIPMPVRRVDRARFG